MPRLIGCQLVLAIRCNDRFVSIRYSGWSGTLWGNAGGRANTSTPNPYPEYSQPKQAAKKPVIGGRFSLWGEATTGTMLGVKPMIANMKLLMFEGMPELRHCFGPLVPDIAAPIPSRPCPMTRAPWPLCAMCSSVSRWLSCTDFYYYLMYWCPQIRCPARFTSSWSMGAIQAGSPSRPPRPMAVRDAPAPT